MSTFDNLLNRLEKSSTDNDIIRLIQHVSRNALQLEEVATLSSKLADTGVSLSLSSCQAADIPSTGGPSSLSTLICPLFLRLKGYTVPKLAVPGRPAGGIDVLATIPGYKASLSREQVVQCLEECRYSHFLAGGEFVPLDARMFRLRQRMGVQDNPYLTTASLVSKKLAASVNYVRLDVRVGPHGNFGRTLEEARLNARMFNDVARLVGLDSGCYLTDATSIYQPYIGRGQALVALAELFYGQASSWLTEHFQTCWKMTETLSGDIPMPDGPTLREAFADNLKAQGSNIREFDLRVNEIRQSEKATLRAPSSGHLSVNIDLLRQMLVQAQASYDATSSLFPDPCGIELLCRPGQQVEAEQPLARVQGMATLEQIASRSKSSIMDVFSVAPLCGPELQPHYGFKAEWVMEGTK